MEYGVGVESGVEFIIIPIPYSSPDATHSAGRGIISQVPAEKLYV